MPREGRNRRGPVGYSPRIVNELDPVQRFLIVCEGKETEPNYFRRFRVPKKVECVDIRGLGFNTISLVDEAIRLKSKEKYDQVWCVLDRDSFPPQQFNAAIERAQAHNIKVAYSNEAFELWFILHFELLQTGIPRADYGVKLTRYLGRRYEKSDEDIYDDLQSHQSDAVRNARRLLDQYPSPNPEQDNPSTTVHLLVEELNKQLARLTR
ncbi:MAG: RloB domain-containing protein [Chloroflexota bacterium]|nr:MAG: RloB domain-containing protein [Chloroflexota bacterium]